MPPGYPRTIQDLSITGDAQGQLLFTQFFRCVAGLVLVETNQDQSQTTWSWLVGAQPQPCCSFARHLVGKMVIHCSFAHH